MLNINLDADDFDQELEKVKIMNEQKKREREFFYKDKIYRFVASNETEEVTVIIDVVAASPQSAWIKAANSAYDKLDLSLDSITIVQIMDI